MCVGPHHASDSRWGSNARPTSALVGRAGAPDPHYPGVDRPEVLSVDGYEGSSRLGAAERVPGGWRSVVVVAVVELDLHDHLADLDLTHALVAPLEKLHQRLGHVVDPVV